MAVRRESVRLDLEDNFSKKMLTAAAATKTLENALRDLDGSAIRTSKSVDRVAADNDRLSTSATRGSASIDKFSGRLGILLKVAGTLGPALVPIGAVGVAGVAALASQLGFAAVGMTSVIVAFQGMGTAFDAVNKASLEPTAENLQAARDALEGLDPAAQQFVRRFQEFRPVLADIRNSAQAGFFPGLTEALDSFEKVAPKVGGIMEAVGAVGGNLIAEGAEALAGPEWSEFMDFIAREAPPALEAMGRSIGNVAEGMADLWMAFDPLSDGMSSWLLDSSRGFSDWADGLSQTSGFQDFIQYIRENGPLVADAAGSIGDALVQIVEAAAPLGGPTLRLISGIADAIAAIADSPLGTPLLGIASAFSAISLATRGLSGLAGVVGSFERLGPAALKAQTGLAGIATKATPLLAASAAVVALGNALGDAFGADLNLSDVDRDLQAIANGTSTDALSRIVDDITRLNDALPGQNTILEGINEVATGFGLLGDTSLDNAVDNVESIDQALAGLVESGKADQARQILENIGAAMLGLPAGASISESVWNDLLGNFDAYSTAVDNAGGSNGIYAQSLHGVAGEAGATRAQVRGLTQAMLDQVSAALGAFDAVTQYREALKAARIQGRKNDEGIQGNTEAALANRHALSDLAGAWNNQSAAVRNNVGKFREARRSFIETATAMGVPIDKAQELADKLLAIPRSTVAGLKAEDRATAKIVGVQRLIDYYGATKANAQALLRDLASGKINGVQGLINKYGLTKAEAKALLSDAASGKLQGILGLLNSVDGRTANTYVNTYHRDIYQQLGHNNLGGRTPLASGGTVGGPRYPYRDRVSAILAPGEEVISNRNGQADRNRALLKAINAGGTLRSERAMGASSQLTINVTAGDLRGSIDSPWGKVDIRGMMRAEAQDIYDQNRTFEGTQRG